MASEKRKNKDSKKAKNKKQKKEEKASKDTPSEVPEMTEAADDKKKEGKVCPQETETTISDTSEAAGDALVDPKKKKKKKSNKKSKDKTEKKDEEKPPLATDDPKTKVDNATQEIKDSKTAIAKNDSGDDSDDEDDDELLAAAAAWAQEQVQTAEGTTSSPKRGKDSEALPLPSGNKTYSLHITQLPFDANDLDIRQLFAQQGCIITSVRLVYDRDERGRKTLFRGVAFADFLDAASYENALKLNRASVRGRKVNIRPSRSKEELADIVSRTKELVQAKIEKSKSAQGDDNATSVAQRKKEKKQEKKAKKKSKLKKHKTPKDRNTEASEKNKKDPDRKLTKKERNRKAAIILSLRRKRGK